MGVDEGQGSSTWGHRVGHDWATEQQKFAILKIFCKKYFVQTWKKKGIYGIVVVTAYTVTIVIFSYYYCDLVFIILFLAYIV